jgi:hypothetical protein
VITVRPISCLPHLGTQHSSRCVVFFDYDGIALAGLIFRPFLDGHLWIIAYRQTIQIGVVVEFRRWRWQIYKCVQSHLNLPLDVFGVALALVSERHKKHESARRMIGLMAIDSGQHALA